MQIKADTREFTRKLRIREHFSDSVPNSNTDDCLVKHPSHFYPKTNNLEFGKILEIIERTDPIHVNNFQDNLSSHERTALDELKEMNDIIVKKADKGNALVIMDKSCYRDRLVMNDHLRSKTYAQCPEDSDILCFKRLKTLMQKHRLCLDKKEFDYITNFDWKSSNFYVLPKIHKCPEIVEQVNTCSSSYVRMTMPESLKGRPIIAGPCAPTQHLSELLEKILSPLVLHQKTYIKDDWDFLRKLPNNIDFPCNLYSCDIVSLYTSINHDLGILALRYWVTKLRDLIPKRFTTDFILESASFVLQNNFFKFDDITYHQLIGTAMGTIFAPPYACLTVGYLEETKLYPELQNYFNANLCKLIISLYFRFMDDGIIFLPKEIDIKTFENILQGLHPDIKFTLEEADSVSLRNLLYQMLAFLDINVILHETGKLETDVYYKPTNNHDYLDYHSQHASHVKDNIPFNLAKRIIVFCSNPETERYRLCELEQWLINCNYPVPIIKKAFKNARLQGPAPNKTNSNVLPFVTTNFCNFDSKNISQISSSLFQSSSNADVNSVFKDCRTVLALKQPPNLLRQLTKASFSSNPNANRREKLEPGLFKCSNNRCKLCKLYIQECKTFYSLDYQIAHFLQQ